MTANNPYMHYAALPTRYVFQWNAGQGGVLPSHMHAPASSLGAADLLEGGYADPNFEYNYPALNKVAPKRFCPPPPRPCGLRAQAAAQLGALGAVVEYGSALAPVLVDISKPQPPPSPPPQTTKRSLASRLQRSVYQLGDLMEPVGSIPIWDGLSSTEKTVALVALGAGALWWLTRKKKNPWRVYSRTRGVSGSLVFTSKRRADDYADYLRKANKPARVRRTRR